jgi:hypothetical protein
MKMLIGFSVLIFSLAFAYIPYLWGDKDFFSGWSIILSGVGGLFGIFIGVVIWRRLQ